MTDADIPTVLALNAPVAHLLSPLDTDRLCQLRAWSAYAQVVETDGEVCAFTLVFGPGSAYDSVNYRWFAERYPEGFLYLDRVAVAPQMRRQGIASRIYAAMEQAAEPQGRLTCEVVAEPPNRESLAFHVGRGYREVGRLAQDGGKVAAMLVKELPS